MTDEELLSKLLNTNGALLSNWYRTLQKNIDLMKYVTNRYSDKVYTDSKEDCKEVCLRIINKVENFPLCPICGKPLKGFGFDTCGSKECRKELREQNKKKTNLEKYGVENQFQRKEIIEYLSSKEIRNKFKLSLEKKYGKGITNPSQIPEAKEKRKQTFQNKYGVDNAGQIPEVKEKVIETSLKHFGCKYYFQTNECRNLRKSPESLEREFKTKKANGTLGVSKAEYDIFDMLKEKFPKAIHQYRSAEYPFNCDFYIPELNLYIEYQGFWTHHTHPYNPKSRLDQQLVKHWKESIYRSKMYEDAINTWTVRDPLKRKITKINSLNWIEFWSVNEVKDWLKQF